MKNIKEDKRSCLFCEKTLFGRIDKKYCNDYCRNSYNNERKSKNSKWIRKINKILASNRKILKTLLAETEETRKIKQEELIMKGFVFTYFTHQYLTKKGAVYYFVYEYGYLYLDNDWILLVKNKEK